MIRDTYRVILKVLDTNEYSVICCGLGICSNPKVECGARHSAARTRASSHLAPPTTPHPKQG
jgi:hypothetical protein